MGLVSFKNKEGVYKVLRLRKKAISLIDIESVLLFFCLDTKETKNQDSR
jgi:hypothetical protein